MKTTWTGGITDKDKKADIKASYEASALIRERLASILNAKIDSRIKNMVKAETYENPNWAYEQADNIAYMRALKEIISLIS